jgi:predicted RNase H-like nuclease (RuvC/YqgF family)
MLGNIFKKDNQDDEKRQMSEGMQSMSNQIGALSKELAEKNAKIEELQKSGGDAQTNAAALAEAKKEMDALHQQIRDLQRKLAEEQATREAEQMAADLIKQQQAKAKQSQPAGTAIGAGSGTSAPAGGAATTSGLAVGGNAWVTREGGLPLRLRSGAGLSHDVRDRLQPGTQMTLLEGPHQADNYSWWHIRTTDGREGWVAGQDLRTQPD